MSQERLVSYWLEFADAADGALSAPERGPLSPSAVRHENGDVVLAVYERTLPPSARAAALATWRAGWERQTGQRLLVRSLAWPWPPEQP